MKLKGIFIVVILLLVIMATGFLYLRGNKNTTKAQVNNSTKAQESKSNEDLVIAPQTPTDKVTVESATLQKDGFVVVRQMDDGKLSQVIEMSKPLKAGNHRNITINLGEADVSNKDLAVVIYEDYGNDGVFNDLDMPAVNADGFMTANDVKTGKPLPTSITEAEDPNKMNMPGMKAMAKVRYTDAGFLPNKIEVNVGDMVEFVNESSKDMWVASVPHPAHTKLPTFDQFRLYKKGAIYRYVFEKKGTWEYHDHINPSTGGVVVVN